MQKISTIVTHMTSAIKTVSKRATPASRRAENALATGNFAVFKTGGKQYRVSVGDLIKIEKIKGEFVVGDKVEFDQVLLKDNGTATTIGTPTIAGAKVSAEIVTIDRGPKLVVMRYIQKSRSGPKKNGHRQPFFEVKITAIA
jgi:large subunit ribosomal protein L21